MHRFRNILVPIHGDASHQPVLARAARLARENGAAIKLIDVVEDLPWYTHLVLPTAEELQALIVRERSEALEGLAQRLRAGGIETATKVLRGRRYLEMIREVQRGGHDLLMKDAEPNERVLFGSTDMHLLRACPCPLWLFKPGHAGRGFAQILAAIDPPPPPDATDVLHLKVGLAAHEEALDTKILELAGSLADQEGAELHVIHAWSAPGEGLLRSDVILAGEQVERYVNDSRAEARKAVERLLSRVPERPPRRFVHLTKGDSADVIAEFAKSHPVDVIVMGTVARTHIPGLLIGNTAETVFQRVECSVLAVKPDGFVSPVSLAN
jgi:nucleotide-binding universal stress UspA family protein